MISTKAQKIRQNKTRLADNIIEGFKEEAGLFTVLQGWLDLEKQR